MRTFFSNEIIEMALRARSSAGVFRLAIQTARRRPATYLAEHIDYAFSTANLVCCIECLVDVVVVLGRARNLMYFSPHTARCAPYPRPLCGGRRRSIRRRTHQKTVLRISSNVVKLALLVNSVAQKQRHLRSTKAIKQSNAAPAFCRAELARLRHAKEQEQRSELRSTKAKWSELRSTKQSGAALPSHRQCQGTTIIRHRRAARGPCPPRKTPARSR